MNQVKYSQFVFFAAALLLAHAFFAVTAVRAQADVTSPTDSIQIVNGADDGDGQAGPPPNNEGVVNAIDNTTNKYLNFLDLGSGLIVTPNAGSTIIGTLVVYTANDTPNRDPASYLLEGSNNAGATWTTISSGALNLPVGRNALGQLITAPGLFFDRVQFSNSTAYTSYRVTFPTLKNAGSTNAMQIGEIQLLNFPPTAASVTISGRVLTSSNRGISLARVILTNQTGESRTALTNGFGYYRLDNVEAGESWVFNVMHKHYQFAPQILTISEELNELNFVAEP